MKEVYKVIMTINQGVGRVAGKDLSAGVTFEWQRDIYLWYVFDNVGRILSHCMSLYD